MYSRAIGAPLTPCPSSGTPYAVPGYPMNYRSTTVPPDWLSIQPPGTTWGVSTGTTFSPAQQPMRFRSATPQLSMPTAAPTATAANAAGYAYGSMPPPPAPGIMAPPAAGYQVYTPDASAQTAQDYTSFVPSAGGGPTPGGGAWADPSLGSVGGVASVEPGSDIKPPVEYDHGGHQPHAIDLADPSAGAWQSA